MSSLFVLFVAERFCDSLLLATLCMTFERSISGGSGGNEC